MSVIKISELTNVIALTTDDTFPVVSEGSTRKATIQQIIDIVGENISVLNVRQVDSVSDVTEENVLYLVPNTSTGSNIYDEYMFIDGHAELIGSQSVDLSNYPTIDDMNTAISNAIGGALNGSY